MKKLSFLAAGLLMLTSCQKPSDSLPSGVPAKGTVNNNVTVFPGTKGGIIGDPMPYFDGEYMNYFYLLEESSKSQVGFHPWALLRTKDFITYEDKGVVLPYVKDAGHQDVGLGTGSVIKDKSGKYHAFYTGYNNTGNTDYYEKIQHATSNDLLTWTKHPEHGFYGGHNDFRDPYVFFNEETNNYWMLITTREDNHGVLKLYTSPNLEVWTYSHVFFRNDAGSYNLECPSVIKIGSKWYLTYSEQGAFRVTHYRYTSDLNSGVWTKPAVDYFDGVGAYAGRMERVHNRVLLTAWQAVKLADYDGGAFDWGGNLLTHELHQLPNGELRAKPVNEVVNALKTAVKYEVLNKAETATIVDKDITFTQSNHSYVTYDKLEKKATKMTFSLKDAKSGIFGLSFAHPSGSEKGELNVAFNLATKKLEFYNVGTLQIKQSLAQAYVPFNYIDEVKITVLSENQCLSIYVEGQQVLSTRMYKKTDRSFGFFALDAAVTFKDVTIYE